MPEVISPDEHRSRILAQLEPVSACLEPLMDARGLVCAEDVRADISLPRFDNSAMDGYAVRRSDVADASDGTPVTLRVVGEIGAGQANLPEGAALPEGVAAKIMTGAPVPSGADTIVPYEWTDRGAVEVTISQAPELGQHVRSAGDDLSEGDLLVAAGTLLTSRHVGLLASVGRARVLVRPRPRVVVLSTGTELRDPGEPLAHDSIYDGNSYLLAGAALDAGAVVHRVGIVPDVPDAFLETLRQHVTDADLVITSGGVSQGDYDVVKAALAPDGVRFGPVAMQPGKPQGFGFVGDRRVPIFCLPGNPVSSFVSFECFVRPALRRMMGLTPEVRSSKRATLTHDVGSPPGRRQYLRGSYDDGHATVAPVGGPGSHLIGELATANCLIVVPEDTTHLDAGDDVDVLLLEESR